jgi:hypothetical protein
MLQANLATSPDHSCTLESVSPDRLRPLKMIESKQDSVQEIKLANLAKKE